MSLPELIPDKIVILQKKKRHVLQWHTATQMNTTSQMPWVFYTKKSRLLQYFFISGHTKNTH